jgi:hypothetical protein
VLLYDCIDGATLEDISVSSSASYQYLVSIQQNRIAFASVRNVLINRVNALSRVGTAVVGLLRSAGFTISDIEVKGCVCADCGNGVSVSGSGTLVSRLNVHDNYFSATPSGGPVVDNAGVASGEYRNNHSPNPAVITSPGFYRVPRVVHGSVDITGAATIAAVSFATLGLPNAVTTTYQVTYGVTPKTGSPAGLGGAPWTTAKATTGFTINIATPPGGTTAITVDFAVTDIGIWTS